MEINMVVDMEIDRCDLRSVIIFYVRRHLISCRDCRPTPSLVQTQCWCPQGRWLPSPSGVRG